MCLRFVVDQRVTTSCNAQGHVITSLTGFVRRQDFSTQQLTLLPPGTFPAVGPNTNCFYPAGPLLDFAGLSVASSRSNINLYTGGSQTKFYYDFDGQMVDNINSINRAVVIGCSNG